MSIQSVIGRIDQIHTMQQQLSDPQSAASATAASGTSSSYTVPGTTSAAGTGTSFSAALASAQAGLPTAAAADTGGTTGLLNSLSGSTASPLSSLTGTTPGATGVTLPTSLTTATSPTATSPTAAAQVQAMTSKANSLVGLPYVWGGGHSGWGPQSGYDCSGFVSAVLHAGGYLSQPADTTSMPNQPGIQSGPGQYVTIYDRAQPGENGHVIIDINGQFYESGGSAGAWGGGGGVEKIGTPSAAYLATFPNVLHPSGL
jgi:cell wall-associated NlpC family hydrolase